MKNLNNQYHYSPEMAEKEKSEEVIRVPLPKREEGEIFGIVDKMLGGGRMMVLCEDGVSRMARIPGKIRRRMWRKEGDVVIVKGINKDAYNIGDVIIFWPMGNKNAVPVIHRIVNKTCINGYCYYQTKGDNNQGQLPFEFNITQDAIVGKAIARIPKLGWIKLWLMGK